MKYFSRRPQQPAYRLEKYHGPQSRHECPQCHDPHSLVLYVDAHGHPLAPICGRCNHEQRCGYNYTPKQFLADHPDDPQACRDHPGHTPGHLQMRPARLEPTPAPLCTIPESLVCNAKSCPTGAFGMMLAGLFSLDAVRRVTDDYQLGVIPHFPADVIFWQIDIQGRAHAGKIIPYDMTDHTDATTCHRSGNISWVHSELKRAGALPNDWALTQCLFGEHLLARPDYKHKKVALVESEKTAVIGAAAMPSYIWMATGGCGNLKASTASVLAGRKVVVWPDKGCFEKWNKIVSQLRQTIKSASFTVCQYMELKDVPDNTDIADLLIGKLQAIHAAEPANVLLRMEMKNPALQTLVTALDLRPVACQSPLLR